MELGTALGLLAFVEQCIKYGDKLVKKCQDYRNADQGTRELLTIIEFNWMKMEAQIKFLEPITASLDKRYIAMQSLILSELEGKLKKATLSVTQLIAGEKFTERRDETTVSERFGSLQEMRPGKKARYALKKESLEAIINDLEKWQARYDPTWMLIMRMEIPAVNEQLNKESQKSRSTQSLFIMTAKEMRDAAKLSIQETTSALQTVWLDVHSFDSIHQPSTGTYPTLFSVANVKYSNEQVMMDTMHCNPSADIPRTTRDVCNLARVLSKVDPTTFGLLKCRGIIKGSEIVECTPLRTKELPTFTFVFSISPELSNPRSLRSILQQTVKYSLNERFELARQLTNSVLYVHTARFVHKNIRPETIVVFENAKSKIGAPFLLGIEKVRHDDAATFNAGDNQWEKNIYRHPTRQGVLPEEVYKMQHDIYSVGVILLEIGLWESFVTYDDSATGGQGYQVPVPNERIAQMSLNGEKFRVKRALQNKEILEELAQQELPIRMGQKYTDVVLSCLRCLDDGDNIGSNTEYVDEDGLIVGVRFVESILDKVQEISF